MKRVLFIIPPNTDYEKFTKPNFNDKTIIKNGKQFGVLILDMPVGVLSLSAYIKQNKNVEVKLVDLNIVIIKKPDFNYTSFKEFFEDEFNKKEILDFNPDFIGISNLFLSGYRNTLILASVLKRIFPKSIIIAGGGIPTNLYKEIFDESQDFDGLCFGEGEKPLKELIESEDPKQLLEKNDSWITKNKIDNNKDNFINDFIINLDEIPMYDYDLLDINSYSLFSVSGTYSIHNGRNGVFQYLTSRGCPNKCSFCSSHSVHGRKIRYHSIERVKQEILRMKTNYNATLFGVQDDHILFDKDRAYEIFKFVHQNNMDNLILGGLAIYSLKRDVLEKLKEIGIKHIILPIESGSEHTLKKIMHKPINLKMVEEVVKNCHDLGFSIEANLIIGFPGETKNDFELSKQFLSTLNISWFRVYLATALPGSEIYKICIENNYISKSKLLGDYKTASISTPEFTAKEVDTIAYDINLYLNFVNNGDMKLKKYDKALNTYKNIIYNVKDHAFAYYYASICCNKLNMKKEENEYLNKYFEIIKENSFWRNFAEKYNLVKEYEQLL